MGLHLITGVPGAGKTLNTIKFLHNKTLENGEWSDRTVYYFNVADLQIDSWVELTEEEARNWYELPDGSIILIDECQQIYPPKGWEQEAEKGISKLDTHRHHGFDLFFVTQHPKLLHAKVRRMVGEHWHFDRKFGQSKSTRYQWSKCQDAPNDYGPKQEAVKETITFDKSVFDLYKSAEIHTHKKHLPLKILFAYSLLGCIGLFFLYLVYYFAFSDDSSLSDDQTEKPEITNIFTDEPDFTSDRLFDFEELSEEYIDLRTPVVNGWPHTAPIYDDIREVKTYPRYNCVGATERIDSCKCYSQQNTILKTSLAACWDVVNNGFFDEAFDPEKREDRPRDATPTSSDGLTEMMEAIDPDRRPRRAILLEYDS